MVVVKIPSDF